MAGPVFKSAGPGASTETSGAAHNLTCPAVVDANDLLIAHLAYEGASVAPTTPLGWNLLSGPTFAATLRVWVYGKLAVGDEDGATVNFGSPANANSRHGRIYSFSPAKQDIATVCGGFVSEGPLTQAQINDADVTTTEADCLAVNLVAVTDDNAVGSFTGETGGDWTEAVAEYTTAATTPDWCLQLQTAAMPSAGTIGGGSFTMAAADGWGVVGFFIKAPPGGTNWSATPSDTFGLTDARAIARGKVVADGFGLTDLATPAKGRAVAVSDGFALTDSAAAAVVNAEQQADGLALTDAATRAAVYARSAADGFGLTDAAVAEPVHFFVQGDGLNLTDAISPATGYARSVADGLALTDSAAPSSGGGGGAHNQQVDDAFALTDDGLVAWTAHAVQGDGIDLTDARAFAQGRALADAFGLTDAAATARGIGRTLADGFALTDSATSAAASSRSVADGLSITDARRLTQGRARADGFGLTDAAAPTSHYQRSRADGFALTDNVSTSSSGAASRTVNDAFGLSDAVAPSSVFQRTRADAFALSDSLAASSDRARALADGFTLSDAVSWQAVLARQIADGLTLVDGQVVALHQGGILGKPPRGPLGLVAGPSGRLVPREVAAGLSPGRRPGSGLRDDAPGGELASAGAPTGALG